MGHLSNISERTWFWLTFILFALIYASITFVNHYVFRTNAFDLGINNNAIYDYAHFRWNDCMIMQPQFENVLSDHFTILPILISPLYWIFGSYTMLIVQYITVLLGGYGIYKFAKLKTDHKYLPVIAMAHFYCIWGIYSALAFDYHDNVMAAMFVPWLFYYFDQLKWKQVAVFFALILISKENMALWMTTLAPGLGLLYKDKTRRWAGIIMGLAAVVYFGLIVKLVIPSLANSNRAYLHFNYDVLGHNFSDALTTIFTRPWYTFKLLFINPEAPDFDNIKPELHLMVLLAGGWAFIKRPQYLFMLLPIYAQKLFSNDFGKWGINAHYSIEFAPILAIAVLDFFTTAQNTKYTRYAALGVVLITFLATIWKIDHRSSKWYYPVSTRFYQKQHYIQKDFSVVAMHKALKLIPDGAIVSAQSFICPHLCFRDYIYLYPMVDDAEYVVLAVDQANPYPLGSSEEVLDSIEAYRHKTNWEIIYNQPKAIIAKKNNIE